MLTEIQKKILVALKNTKKNKNITVGICHHIHNFYGNRQVSPKELSEEYEKLFRMWPKFSGNIQFPVSGIDGMSAEESYVYTKNLWRQSSQYGRDRMELLDFMISQLESQLSKT